MSLAGRILEFFQKNKETDGETIKKVSLEELSYEIERSFKELESKAKITKEEINKNLALMINDLRVQINVLKFINLERRKEDERLKRMVLENLGVYINHLETLIIELEKTNNLEVKDCILKIQFVLDNFYKKSFKNYEKATILVGEEIGRVKEIIKHFNKDFIKMVQKNSFIFTKITCIEEFRKLDNKIEALRKIKEEIDKQIESFGKLKEKLENQKYIFEEDYYIFKQSEEFKEILMQEQRFNKELINLNNEIMKIKEKINIKFLLKYYHNDTRCNELLKSYKENFIKTLENDETLEIVRLVEKAKAMNIKKEILDLKEKNKKLKIKDNISSQTKLKIFEDRIKNVDLEIYGLKEKELVEMKKFKKFNEKEASLVNEKINKAKDILGNIEIVNLNKKEK